MDETIDKRRREVLEEMSRRWRSVYRAGRFDDVHPALFDAHMVGVLANIAACEKALAELQERLRRRKEGFVTKGKKPTVESVSKSIQTILSAEYARHI